MLNPETSRIAPTAIDNAMVELSFDFLCIQLVFITKENNIKQPQQACRAIDDKYMPGF